MAWLEVRPGQSAVLLGMGKRTYIITKPGVQWVDGVYMTYDECIEVDPETIGDYTGLADRNNKKIFKGDIVVFADFFNDEIHRGVVYWCDLAFWFDCTETEGDDGIYSLAYISANVLEVIGNIYDNPELLGGDV